mgnify:FL=1
MKEFEGQRRFNPAQLPNLGEPLQTLDITPQISRAFQEKQRMDQPYLRSLERNEKQEFENLQIEAENENRRAANEEATLNKLMAFAPTLEKLGQAEIKRRDQEAQIRGKMKAFDMDFSNITELPYYQEQMAALENSRMSTDAKAAAAFQRTQNYELARVYKSLNGAERIGFAKTYLAQKQAEWPAYLSEQLTSNNELQLNVGGSPFTPSTAEGAAQTAAAAKALYRQYILDNGMSGVNDFFLEENFTGGENGARTQTQKILAKRNKHDARMHAENNYIRITAENAAAVKTKPAAANGIDVLNAIGLLQDKNGNPLDGFAKATKFKEHVEGLIESGVLRSQADVMRYLGNTPDPVTKGSMADRLTLSAGLRLKVTERNISDYRDYDGMKKAQYYGPGGYHEQAMAAAEASRADPDDRMTMDEYLKLQQTAVSYTGTTDKRLEHWWKHESEHGQNFQDNLRMIKEMADSGQGLSIDLVRSALGYSPQAEQYINIAKSQANSRQRTGGFSHSYKVLRTAVQKASGYAGRDSEQVSGKQAFLLNDLHRQVKAQAQRLIESGDPQFQDPLVAEQHALDEVLKVAYANGLTTDGKLKGLMYSSGSNNEFDTYFASDAVSSRRENANRTLQVISNQQRQFRDDLETYGVDLNTPKAYVHPQVLLNASQTYYNKDGSFNKDFRMPEGIKELDALIPDMNQIQILQKLLETNEIIPVDENNKPITIAPPPSMDPKFKPLYEGGGIDQNILNLYGKAKSGLESVRIGASSSNGFQSARIPPQFEAPLKKVATGAELPYEVVAALVQTESGFEDKRSKVRPDGTFDGGPFQTNTQYYKYTPGDIAGNADNALTQLLAGKAVLEQNGITPGHPDYIDGMLASYNAGQGTLKFKNGRLVPSATHRGYIGRVRKSLAGMGDQTQLANNSLVRPTFHVDTGQGYAVEGATDYKGRPVVFSREAATAFDRMVQDSGGVVKYSDVHSAQRSESKNREVGGVPGSRHLGGNAVDIHGASKAWIKKHGAKYGFTNLDYDGHDGHFDFK